MSYEAYQQLLETPQEQLPFKVSLVPQEINQNFEEQLQPQQIQIVPQWFPKFHLKEEIQPKITAPTHSKENRQIEPQHQHQQQHQHQHNPQQQKHSQPLAPPPTAVQPLISPPSAVQQTISNQPQLLQAPVQRLFRPYTVNMQQGMYPMGAIMNGSQMPQMSGQMPTMTMTPMMGQNGQPYMQMQMPQQMPLTSTKSPMQMDPNIVTMPMGSGGYQDMSTMSSAMNTSGMGNMNNNGFPLYPMMSDNQNYPGLFAQDQYFDGSPMGGSYAGQQHGNMSYHQHGTGIKPRVSSMPPRSRR